MGSRAHRAREVSSAEKEVAKHEQPGVSSRWCLICGLELTDFLAMDLAENKIRHIPVWRWIGGIVLIITRHDPCAFAQGEFLFSNYRGAGIGEPISVSDPVTGTCLRPLGDTWHADLVAGVPALDVGLSVVTPVLDFNAFFGPGYL